MLDYVLAIPFAAIALAGLTMFAVAVMVNKLTAKPAPIPRAPHCYSCHRNRHDY